jgi:hypothetical protein
MKIILKSILLLLTAIAFGQKNIVGKYYHNFGHLLLLKSDSTYEFKTGFDLSSSWSHGIWSFKKDTVFLINTPVFDTLNVGQGKDTFVFSSDPKPERIDSIAYIATLLSGGGQNRASHPTKLLAKKKNLLVIDPNGQVVKKDLYDPLRQKYFSTKFYKSKE